MLNIDTKTYDTLKAFGAFANKFGSDSTTVARLGIGESGHVVNTTTDCPRRRRACFPTTS